MGNDKPGFLEERSDTQALRRTVNARQERYADTRDRGNSYGYRTDDESTA